MDGKKRFMKNKFRPPSSALNDISLLERIFIELSLLNNQISAILGMGNKIDGERDRLADQLRSFSKKVSPQKKSSLAEQIEMVVKETILKEMTRDAPSATGNIPDKNHPPREEQEKTESALSVAGDQSQDGRREHIPHV
jgi:hypothetical protein